MDVLIVGGGVIGCAIAYELAKAGADVTLLERGEPAAEASGAAAGILIPPPWAAAPGPFGDLCRASLGLYSPLVEALQAETGVDVQYLTTPLLAPAETEAAAIALRQVARPAERPSGRLRADDGLQLEWVEGEALRRLEPGLSPTFPGALYSSGQRHVNPALLTRALARAAARRGARLRPQTPVTGFATGGGRVTGVRTADEVFPAGHVVLAAGPWTGPLARKLGVDLPTPPMRGQMLAYRRSSVRHIIWGSEGYLVPKPDGLLFAGATVEDVGFRRRTTARGLAWLRRTASALVPALRDAEVASAWAGLRPGSPDGLPLLGPLPGWQNVTVASGHFRNGILLAPITGKLMVQLIVDGRTEIPLQPFDPRRFA